MCLYSQLQSRSLVHRPALTFGHGPMMTIEAASDRKRNAAYLSLSCQVSDKITADSKLIMGDLSW